MQVYDEEYHDTDAEFQELWDLLIESYARTGSLDNWPFDRLQDWKYGSNVQRAAQNPGFFTEHAHLWRDTAGRLLGFCIAYRRRPEVGGGQPALRGASPCCGR